jgi:methylated-DNA-[protein]-cysteine S-methyltransferase
MSNKNHVYYRSPIGLLEIAKWEEGIVHIRFVEDPPEDVPQQDRGCDEECMEQLAAYFAGKPHIWDALSLTIKGTPFQKKVWREMQSIPHGETRTYGEIAKAIGYPKACRAVGSAVGANPCVIVIPCHRVVPKAGGIGHYSAGRKRKEWLLSHET